MDTLVAERVEVESISMLFARCLHCTELLTWPMAHLRAQAGRPSSCQQGCINAVNTVWAAARERESESRQTAEILTVSLATAATAAAPLVAETHSQTA